MPFRLGRPSAVRAGRDARVCAAGTWLPAHTAAPATTAIAHPAAAMRRIKPPDLLIMEPLLLSCNRRVLCRTAGALSIPAHADRRSGDRRSIRSADHSDRRITG